MKIYKLGLMLSSIFILIACDIESTSSNIDHSVTSSKVVSGTSSTMAECKQRLDETAKKYNVKYIVIGEYPDSFLGKIVKNGKETNLGLLCIQKGNLFEGNFEVPD